MKRNRWPFDWPVRTQIALIRSTMFQNPLGAGGQLNNLFARDMGQNNATGITFGQFYSKTHTSLRTAQANACHRFYMFCVENDPLCELFFYFAMSLKSLRDMCATVFPLSYFCHHFALWSNGISFLFKLVWCIFEAVPGNGLQQMLIDDGIGFCHSSSR